MPRALVARLQAGDPAAARLVGLPTRPVPRPCHGAGGRHHPGDDRADGRARRADPVLNEAWLVLGVLFLTALLLVPAMVKPKKAA